MKNSSKITAIIIVGLFLFFLDRIIKAIVVSLGQNFSFAIIAHWFRIELMFNNGIAFGLPMNFWLLMILYIIIILALCFLAANRLKNKDILSFGSIMFVIFGAFSNILDRVRFGHVIDYFYLRNFSVFNLADAMIVVGAIVFILFNFFKSKKNASNS